MAALTVCLRFFAKYGSVDPAVTDADIVAALPSLVWHPTKDQLRSSHLTLLLRKARPDKDTQPPSRQLVVALAANGAVTHLNGRPRVHAAAEFDVVILRRQGHVRHELVAPDGARAFALYNGRSYDAWASEPRGGPRGGASVVLGAAATAHVAAGAGGPGGALIDAIRVDFAPGAAPRAVASTVRVVEANEAPGDFARFVAARGGRAAAEAAAALAAAAPGGPFGAAPPAAAAAVPPLAKLARAGHPIVVDEGGRAWAYAHPDGYPLAESPALDRDEWMARRHLAPPAAGNDGGWGDSDAVGASDGRDDSDDGAAAAAGGGGGASGGPPGAAAAPPPPRPARYVPPPLAPSASPAAPVDVIASTEAGRTEVLLALAAATERRPPAAAQAAAPGACRGAAALAAPFVADADGRRVVYVALPRRLWDHAAVRLLAEPEAGVAFKACHGRRACPLHAAFPSQRGGGVKCSGLADGQRWASHQRDDASAGDKQREAAMGLAPRDEAQLWRLLRERAAPPGAARALVVELPAAAPGGDWPDTSGAPQRSIFGARWWRAYAEPHARVGVAWRAAAGGAVGVRRALRRTLVPFEVGRECADDEVGAADAPDLAAWFEGLGGAPCGAAACAFCGGA